MNQLLQEGKTHIMLNPRPLTEDNAIEIKEFLKYSDKYMSLAKFPTLYLWHEYSELSYDIKDDFLFLFECNFDNSTFMPYGNGDLEKAMFNLEEYCKKVSKQGMLYCMGEEDKKNLLQIFPDRYQVEEQEQFNEYVYLRENLAELTGKKYAKKRNHISKFMRKYGDVYEYCSINNSDRDELKKLMDKWCIMRDCGPEDTSKFEQTAILKFLANDAGLQYKGGAIRVNGNIEAFALGGKISDDMAVVYFEKADTKFDGIYPMLNKQYVINEWPNVKYINRQEDMGMEGLRKSKMSYYPEFMVKNYSLKLK